jgi:hypothetical protein
MKAFIKQWLLVFALVVLSVFCVSSIFTGYWEISIFVLQLLAATFVICLFQQLIERLPVKSYLLKYLRNFAMGLASGFGLGRLWNWYASGSALIVFASVIPAFAGAIVLDLFWIRNDVNFINRQIQLRKQKKQEENNDC